MNYRLIDSGLDIIDPLNFGMASSPISGSSDGGAQPESAAAGTVQRVWKTRSASCAVDIWGDLLVLRLRFCGLDSNNGGTAQGRACFLGMRPRACPILEAKKPSSFVADPIFFHVEDQPKSPA